VGFASSDSGLFRQESRVPGLDRSGHERDVRGLMGFDSAQGRGHWMLSRTLEPGESAIGFRGVLGRKSPILKRSGPREREQVVLLGPKRMERVFPFSC
jgi:hypothetical protein